MIVGTGIFAASGAATEAAGSGILLAIVLGGTVALATGISAAQLGVNFPEEGGAFTWARSFGHETAGFVAGCGYLGKALVSMSVVGLALTTYLAQVVPGLPLHVVAAIGVLVVTALNVLAIDLTSRLVIGLLAVIVALLGHTPSPASVRSYRRTSHRSLATEERSVCSEAPRSSSGPGMDSCARRSCPAR